MCHAKVGDKASRLQAAGLRPQKQNGRGKPKDRAVSKTKWSQSAGVRMHLKGQAIA